ncbi:MAG: serine hydrolase [Firmicutes bacterium]|nr:serine hydrolase [Bacillota bacterium]
MEKLEKMITEMAEASGENVSVLIKELGGSGRQAAYDSGAKMPSASTIKVPIMLAALEKVRTGDLRLDEKIYVGEELILEGAEAFENGPGEFSLHELVAWMIITSDNTATNTLINLLGMEYINGYMRETLQVKTTVLQRCMLDKDAVARGLDNYITHDDLSVMFEKLYGGEILTEDLRRTALDILYSQRHQDQVLRYIWEPVRYAHKTGSLTGLNHDAGVIHINVGKFYIGVSVYDSPNKRGNRQLSGNIGRLVYDYLHQIDKG